ncbi:bifunctional DNA-binding transcriptional regulator/O6-methylguanine-DNA methyltransferase Ada [Paracoccus methylovorus]|uniref:Bifunctional DNA-binding transcriptional regulator/O6-methylguanine-DNA methyltransferase Ada n=1 Tax=Paracoccus methylovorus TaxID=2812658 RepID=A0ABX7JS64_9RHOB|nr:MULTISPECIES: bifunctional DNA-binding transcriptional regulator/O6-methylguanine-DNA methyltransferase Ada [Paracoccus]QRZ15849.1 bifunctional DNA-binding transcriptional regulator/O6-methylguanine-DNA methyltransferase Ada [Paracoccus methylovorus]
MDHAPIPTESDPRWQHVLTRDAAADGSFVYAVRTTGVYCRPSCPARRAKPQNVTLYPSPAQAEAAGFRPCRRCNPKGASVAEANAALVAAACRLIEQAETPLSLHELAEAAGMSPFHFHRQFKAITGLTPRAYAAAHRASRLRAQLAKGTSITGAIYEAGFNSNSRFYESADGMLGMTPSAWRKGGVGTSIRFALGQCTLGAILVAQSQRGICAIALGDDPEVLLHDFQDRFPAATLIGADPEFEALVARVIGFVEAPGLGLDLPLDIRGTAFQQRVWQALRQIPPGTTASYADIARSIGEPRASRAVAQACATNGIAVAIPCHRVVRSDGGLSGYRWGVERKRALLDREGATPATA